MGKAKYYDKYLWCSNCQRWILKTHVQIGKNNALICPICHSKLRTKPKDKYQWLMPLIKRL